MRLIPLLPAALRGRSRRFFLPLLVLVVVLPLLLAAASGAFRADVPDDRSGKPADVRTMGAAPPVYQPTPQETAKALALFGDHGLAPRAASRTASPTRACQGDDAAEIWRAHPEWKTKPVRVVNTHPRPPGEEGLTPAEREKRAGEER